MLTVAKVTQGQADDYADYLGAKTEPGVLADYYFKDGDRVTGARRWQRAAGTLSARPVPAPAVPATPLRQADPLPGPQ